MNFAGRRSGAQYLDGICVELVNDGSDPTPVKLKLQMPIVNPHHPVGDRDAEAGNGNLCHSINLSLPPRRPAPWLQVPP